MRRFFIGLAVAPVALAAVSYASAADRPVHPRPTVTHDPCGAAQFTGFYFGGNLGANPYTAQRSDLDGFLTDNSGWTATDIAVTAGVQAGYDWQSCNKVFGLVADWNWSNAKAATFDNPNAAPGDNAIRSEMNWFSTFRARAGLAADNALYYVTGGLAAARIKTSVVDPPAGGTFSKTRWGFVGGAGAEFLLGNNWSLNTEVLYMQFADQNATVVDGGGTPFAFDFNDSAWVARVGLNYRWGGGSGPSHPSLPVKAMAPAYSCGPARFTGGYVGASIGSNAYTADRDDQDGFLTDNSGWTGTDIAAALGIQAGYDWQSCHQVFGWVADVNWTNAKNTIFDNPNGPDNNSIRSNMDWFGTVRARAGVAVGDTLIYITGGVAAANIDTTVADPPVAFSFSKTRWGVVGGAGAEFALGNNWSLNTEFLYFQFAEHTPTGFDGADSFRFGLNDSAWVSRFALNYRWGGDPGTTYAASMPVKAPAAAYGCGPARFNGGYVGGNVGGVAYTASRNDLDGFLTDNAGWTATDFGATAGVQAGYDWQSCGKVFGVVADLNWTNAEASLVEDPNGAEFRPVRSNMDWFGTLRTRAGLAANNTLVYITGGVAVADIETTITDPPDTFNFGKTRWGVVGGAGAEVDLGNNWSVNGEVLYMQFAKHTATGVDGGGTAFRFDMNDSAWVGRLGLNYRFSSAAPVTSKY